MSLIDRLRSPMDQARVKELFNYVDGRLVANKSISHRKQGSNAGWIDSNGYRRVKIEGKCYLTHRLIWLWHGNELPQFLDHIDNDPTNNRIENLRIATRRENNSNVKLRSNNTSGAKGVAWNPEMSKWHVSVQVGKRKMYFGCHEDFELAELLAIEARNKYHREFARHG